MPKTERPRGLRVRKLADTMSGIGPPWPLAGIAVVGDWPVTAVVPMDWGQRAAGEGWLTFENPRWVVRPSGPKDNPWVTLPHTLLHADALVLHTIDGDVRYRVVHQPDKYADPGGDDTPVTDEIYAAGATRVDWFYVAELEG